jgi:hypothetical protein
MSGKLDLEYATECEQCEWTSAWATSFFEAVHAGCQHVFQTGHQIGLSTRPYEQARASS